MPILFGTYIVLILIVEKVRNTSSDDPSSAVPDQPAPPKPAVPSASDILGLTRGRLGQRAMMGRQPVSLEMEVDQYLSNPNSGTSILDFWQVVLILTSYM